MKEITLQVWEKQFHYRLSNWLALNQEHYQKWQNMPDDSERNRFLTSILRGNLLSMAKGLGWFIEQEVKVTLREVSPSNPYPFQRPNHECLSGTLQHQHLAAALPGAGQRSVVGARDGDARYT
ncbi:MAG: hypothetical protein IPL65_22295 [Lewinellaceae bacterium]|nr:hypothetical protein [Lewinellaceae bacterium]